MFYSCSMSIYGLVFSLVFEVNFVHDVHDTLMQFN